jgi:hypothetical protein
MVGSSAAAAASAGEDCAAMVSLLRQARTDFPSLREKKMDPGKCSFRASEYKCAWHFPGDKFDASDTQASRLVDCVAAYPASQRMKVRGREAAFAVDPDLTILIPAPELDDDGWNVTLTIRSSWKAQ